MIGKYLQKKWKNDVVFPDVRIWDYFVLHEASNGKLTFKSHTDLPPIEFFGYKLIIRSGFKWDGASVPRFAWPLFAPFDDDTIWSALVHDWGYSVQEIGFFKINKLFFRLVTVESGFAVKGLLFSLVTGTAGYIPWCLHKKHVVFCQEKFNSEGSLINEMI